MPPSNVSTGPSALDDAFSASIPPAVQLEHDLQMATLRHRKEARELRSKARRREKEARAAAEQLEARLAIAERKGGQLNRVRKRAAAGLQVFFRTRRGAFPAVCPQSCRL